MSKLTQKQLIALVKRYRTDRMLIQFADALKQIYITALPKMYLQKDGTVIHTYTPTVQRLAESIKKDRDQYILRHYKKLISWHL